MKKIALIWTNYGPYHFSRVNAVHSAGLSLGWETIGLELSRQEKLYPWYEDPSKYNFPFISLESENALEDVSTFSLTRKLIDALQDINPDVLVIAGYARVEMIAAAIWGRINKKSNILLSASKEDDFQRAWIKESLKKGIFNLYQGAIVGGHPQRAYMTKLGIDASKVFDKCNVVGNQIFEAALKSDHDSPIPEKYFLTINRFVPKKNLFNLLSAYADYCRKSDVEPHKLVMCGDGPLRKDIEAKIEELNLRDKVYLPGFLQVDELLPYLAHATCFIHASLQEQWGLVVNEAMAAGLPVLVSNRCGCFQDLVIEGANGYGFDPENSAALSKLMLKMASGSLDLKKMSENSLSHIEKYSPESFAQNLLKLSEILT